MKLSFKYRIYPNKSQEKLIINQLNFCRFLYNCALEERNSFYKKYKKSLSYYDQATHLKDLDINFFHQDLKIHSQTLQDTLKRVDKAYQNFFRRLKAKSGKAGFPRFRSSDKYDSITFPQVINDLSGGPVKKINNKIKISNIGEVRINWHRPFKGRCKTATIKKECNKFYLILSCSDIPNDPLKLTGKTCAIDLGINSFITLDDGTKFHHPKPYKTSKEKLAYLQKKLELKRRGSNKRKQVKSQIAKQFAKITNIRSDFQHKISKKIVENYDKVAIENLNVKSMMESKGLHHKDNISEASFGSFIQKITYKAERAGKKIIKVNPKNTSKMCSCCKNIKDDLTLKDRIYKCDHCKVKIDRDINAAINIRQIAFGYLLAPGTGAAKYSS